MGKLFTSPAGLSQPIALYRSGRDRFIHLSHDALTPNLLHTFFLQRTENAPHSIPEDDNDPEGNYLPQASFVA